jgi:RHH-type proline utilization regulon transcriptional repressor/proline dehydrogenase/delta 1-pyrroline-5-carboxylate dehydrogenase
MKILTAWVLGAEIRKSRAMTPTAIFLRFGSLYPVLRSEFLKLVDAASSVASPSEYLYQSIRPLLKELPPYLRVIFWVGEKIVPNRLSDAVIRFAINNVLSPFFLLKDEKTFWKTKKRFEAEGAGIILDVVGEEALFASEAKNYSASYECAMKTFGGKVAVKLSSLVPSVSFNASNYTENKRVLKEKFASVLSLAREHGVSVTLDAEEYFKWCHLIEDVFCETVAEERFCNMQNVGIALQAYRKDSFASAERLLAAAKGRGCPITVRVVKGAYWDTEWAIAEQNGWEYPLFEKKEETDANFDRIVSFFLKNRGHIHLAVATQNPRNIAHALAETNGDYLNFEFQVLFGLGEAVRRTLRRLKIPVSVYCPLVRQGGSILDALAYLVRRILENTAGNSCLLENL